MKITFVIPSRNNLEFLQLAYESIRNLDTVHQILVLDDASTDDTWSWLKGTMSIDPELTCFRNDPDNGRIGIVGMFDKGIEMATTDIIMAFHADMVACKDLDKNILKHLKPRTVVSATRVEPPLHPEGPEKIIRNLGIEVEEFNFDSWYEISEGLKEDRQTEGIFAPWCMYKEDFLAIGGHDELFAPQSKEDSDLFNRFQLNGYKFIQPWDALVYHFTSRGSRFNKHSGGSAGKNSEEWKYTTTKNMRNFIRKWGTPVLHDRLMKPIIPPKFNIGLILNNANSTSLYHLEPWFSKIWVHPTLVVGYIAEEQKNTLINLKDRVRTHFSEYDTDIVVRLDGTDLDQETFGYIQKLSEIIDAHGELGTFELGNLKIEIHSLEEYQESLIFI
jgi:glycosyltransferase involved in cell wall biosynthesis